MGKRIINIIVNNKVIFFTIIALYFSLEHLIPFGYMRIHDVSDSFISRFMLLGKAFFQYGITYWFPSMLCGVDRIAQDLLHVHPVESLFMIFPAQLAYGIVMFLQFFLSGYFTYLLCRKQLGFSEKTSVFAGLAFSLIHKTDINYQFGFVLFPFILLAINNIYEKSYRFKHYWLWVIPLAVLYSFCSSLPWTLPFTLLFLSLWFILVKRQKTLKFWGIFFIFCSVTVLFQLKSIEALIANAGLAHRCDWAVLQGEGNIFIEAVRESLSVFRHPLNQLNSKVLLILTLFSLIFSRAKSKKFNSLFILLLFTTAGVVVVRIIKALGSQYLLFFKGFGFIRIYEMAHFFYALCAAYIFEIIPDKWKVGLLKDKIKISVVTIIFVIAVVGLLGRSLIFKKEHLMTWLLRGNYTSSFKNSALDKLVKKERIESEPFRVATIADTWSILQPAYANAYGLETVDGYVNIYSKRYQLFWAKVIEPFGRYRKGDYDYFMNWGNRVYLFDPTFQPPANLFEGLKPRSAKPINFKDHYRLNLLSLANTKYILSEVPVDDNNLILVFKPLVNYNSLSKKEMLLGRFKRRLNSKDNDFFIYQNKQCFPRFFITSKIKSFKETDKLLEAMAEAGYEELKNVFYTKEKYANHIPETKLSFNSYNIDIIEYSPDFIKLTVNIDGKGVLVGANSYNPNWKVYVNGVEQPLIPAYHTFWGVFLDKDSKEVVFCYEPPYKTFGRRMIDRTN